MRRFIEKYGSIFGYLALAVLLVGGSRYLITRNMDAWNEVLLIGGAVLLALFVALRPQQVKEALSGRKVRYGTNTALITLAFLAIVVGVNYLAGRYYYRYDATEQKRYTLSEQTKQVLDSLEQDIEMTGFFTPNDPQRAGFEQLIDQYTYQSDNIFYTWVDPDREPTRAMQYDPPPSSALIVESGDRIQRVFNAEEQDITSAILSVTRAENKVIYFTTGHQEHAIQGSAAGSYSQIVSVLRDQNYDVETITLATAGVPEDAAVVIIAGPQTEFLEEEIEALRAYLQQGGKAMVMVDPDVETGLNDTLAEWDVAFGSGLVIDPVNTIMGQIAAPAVSNYTYSQITENLPMSFYPVARPVEEIEGEDVTGSVTVQALAETSAESWAEQDTQASEVEFDEGVDQPGPLTLLATVDAPAEGDDPDVRTRMVLVGDSDFVSNEYLVQGNAGVFLNSVNWLAEEEDLIAIGPEPPEQRQIFLSAIQTSTLFFISVILIPVTLLGAGFVVWLRRR